MSLTATRPRATFRRPRQRPQRRISADLAIMAGLVAYAFLARAAVAFSLPPWQSPDEPKHFEYVRVLVEKRGEFLAQRRLPALDDAIPTLQQQVIASMEHYHFWDYLHAAVPDPLPASFQEAFGDSWSQLHRPSLYYDLAALPLLPVQDQPLEAQLTAVRLASAMVSAAAVVPAFEIGRLVARGDRFVRVACAALSAMLPMAVFIGGAVSVDNLLLLFGTLAVYGMSRGVVLGFTWRVWLLILGSLAASLLTKRGAVMLLPGGLACGLLWAASLPRRSQAWLLGGLAAAAVVLVAGVASGALARVLPLETATSTLGAYAFNDEKQPGRLLGIRLAEVQTWQIVGVQLDAYFNSFWGIFGWFNVLLAAWVYRLLLALTAVCALGCLGWAFGLGADSAPPRAERHRRFRFLFVATTLVATALIAGLVERLAQNSFNEVPQGRYLFVVLGAIAALYALGARAWLPASRFGTHGPATVLVGLLVVLDVYAYAGVIWPFFVSYAR